jgi:hypothetical protein
MANTWYLKLREFYDHLLFSQNAEIVPEQVGPLLVAGENTPNASAAQKNWYKAILGNHLIAASESTRMALVNDPKYGREFFNAMAVADSQRSAQIQEVAKAVSNPAESTPSLIYDMSDFRGTRANTANKWGGGLYPSTVHSEGGKSIVEFRTDGGSIYVAPRADDVDSSWHKTGYSFSKVEPLLHEGQADVFYGSHGSKQISKVEQKKLNHPSVGGPR